MEKYKKLAFVAISVAILVLLGYLFVKYTFGIFLPFLIAFLIVAMARPIINKICKKTSLSKPIVSIFVLVVLLVSMVASVALLSIITAEQIGNITQDLINNLSSEENYVSTIFDLIERLENKLPFINDILGDDEAVYNLAIDMLTNGAKSLSLKLTSFLAGAIAALPNLIVTLIVLVLSLFYFAKDYDKIGNMIIARLPRRVGNIALIFKNDVLDVVTKYIKSYVILLALTFAELISGFLILGVKNSFILALIIALADMLPILGAGTVLVPWSLVMLIMGDFRLGIGLFILAGITYFSRQFLEPKILSDQMNIHPLITLFAMYAGLKLAGFFGLIIAPIVAFIIKITLDRTKYEKNVEKPNKL